MLGALALLVALVGAAECAPRGLATWNSDYLWDQPLSATTEQAWREAVTRGDGRIAYDILRAHGRFMGRIEAGRGWVELCDHGIERHEVLLRLALGATRHALPDAALEIVNHALGQPDLPPLNRASFLELRACFRNWKDAQRDFEEALALAPGEAGLRADFAIVLAGLTPTESVFRRLDNARKALAELETALQLDPSDPTVLFAAARMYSFLPAAFGGDGRKALRFAREFGALDPLGGRLLTGWAYLGLGRVREAERQFLIGYDQPESTLQRYRVGKHYAAMEFATYLANVYIATGRHTEAFDLLREWKDRYPDDGMPLYQIGKAAAVTGRHLEEGKAHLRQWLEHPTALYSTNLTDYCDTDGYFAYAHYRLGQIHDQLDEIDEARAEYQKALELEPLEEFRLALLRLP